MRRFSELFARNASLVLAAALFAAHGSVAQSAPRAQVGGAQSRPSRAPRFEDYPVKEVYRGRAADVRLDGRRARMFRTRLREGARTGPNFAGRYAFVLWGCGTGCAQSAVVDLQTGRAYFTPLEYHDITDMEDEQARRRVFRLDSRLLVLTQSNYDRWRSYTAYYYLFERGRFRLLRKAVGRHPETEETDTQD